MFGKLGGQVVGMSTVQEAIAATGYRPNLMARALAEGKSSMVALVLPDINNPFYPEFVRVAERVRHSIETQAGAAVRDIPGLRITSSFGVASIKLGAKDAPELIDQADNALYESKKSGRNRVSVWSGARSVGAEAEAEA